MTGELLLERPRTSATPHEVLRHYPVSPFAVVQIMDRLDLAARCIQEIYALLAGDVVFHTFHEPRRKPQWSYVRSQLAEVLHASCEPLTTTAIYEAMAKREVPTSKRNIRIQLSNLVQAEDIVRLPTGAYLATCYLNGGGHG